MKEHAILVVVQVLLGVRLKPLELTMGSTNVGPALFQQSQLDARLLRNISDTNVKLSGNVMENLASPVPRCTLKKSRRINLRYGKRSM